MKLKKILYVFECNTNLILFKQLYKSNITFVDNKDNMRLI